MLSEVERVKSKAQKKDERIAMRNPEPWYKPFSWVPPKTEKITDAKGREKVRVIRAGYHRMNYRPGNRISDSKGQVYEVQNSGALKRIEDPK